MVSIGVSGCDWMVGMWIVACKRSGLERKRDVWLRCVQGWLKKYYLQRSKGGDFFKATCLPLLICFAELRERLTNTLQPVWFYRVTVGAGVYPSRKGIVNFMVSGQRTVWTASRENTGMGRDHYRGEGRKSVCQWDSSVHYRDYGGIRTSGGC